jgi:hypothetical protein
MRALIYILLTACVFIGCESKNSNFSKEHSLQNNPNDRKVYDASNKRKITLEIRYVDPTITSITAIDCEQFESNFQEQIQKLNISIDSELLLNFLPSSVNEIDCRMKFSYMIDDKKENICLSSTGVFFIQGSNKYMTNFKLYSLLKEAIPIWQ